MCLAHRRLRRRKRFDRTSGQGRILGVHGHGYPIIEALRQRTDDLIGDAIVDHLVPCFALDHDRGAHELQGVAQTTIQEFVVGLPDMDRLPAAFVLEARRRVPDVQLKGLEATIGIGFVQIDTDHPGVVRYGLRKSNLEGHLVERLRKSLLRDNGGVATIAGLFCAVRNQAQSKYGRRCDEQRADPPR